MIFLKQKKNIFLAPAQREPCLLGITQDFSTVWSHTEVSATLPLPTVSLPAIRAVPLQAAATPVSVCCPGQDHCIWGEKTRTNKAKTVFNKDLLPIRTRPLSCSPESLVTIFSLIQGHWHMTRYAQLAGRRDNIYEHSGFGLWAMRDGWKAKVLTSVGIVKVMLK